MVSKFIGMDADKVYDVNVVSFVTRIPVLAHVMNSVDTACPVKPAVQRKLFLQALHITHHLQVCHCKRPYISVYEVQLGKSQPFRST